MKFTFEGFNCLFPSLFHCVMYIPPPASSGICSKYSYAVIFFFLVVVFVVILDRERSVISFIQSSINKSPF